MFNLVKRIATAGLAGMAAVALAGCTSGSEGAEPGRLLIVTGLYPFQYLAEQVAGDGIEVVNLTPPGAEPHDLELTPKQVGLVEQADLIIVLSGLQPAFDEAIAQVGGTNRLEVGQIVSLIELAGDSLTAGDDPADADTGEHSDQPAGLLGLDPHLWLDPLRLAELAGALAGQLGQIDPPQATAYTERAAQLQQRLVQVDNSYRDGLAHCERTTFVTSHAAFGYLAWNYGLHQVAIAGVNPDAEPTPGRLAAIQQLVRRYDITTIFFETLASPQLAQTLAQDLGLQTAVLDPIEGITAESAATDYPGLMQANLAALRLAGDCQ